MRLYVFVRYKRVGSGSRERILPNDVLSIEQGLFGKKCVGRTGWQHQDLAHDKVVCMPGEISVKAGRLHS